jgi:LPXTG-motif cell wall-anchored protein
MSGQSSSTTSNAPGATTPPVTNQTPSNTVGSGQTGQSSAQSTTSNTGQSTASSDQSAANQNANQGVRHYSDMDQNAGKNNNAGNNLPQTASPLPLIGFLGLASLVSGLISRRRK